MCHGRPTLKIAAAFGWLPGARYTNLRNLRGCDQVGLIDIDWEHYDFERHLAAVRDVRPHLTVARDVIDCEALADTLEQAWELSRWASKVIIVPKDVRLTPLLTEVIPPQFLLGYSVPTRYGATLIPLEAFGRRPVHLLGGRPDVQQAIARKLQVYSFDGNRITLDAAFGKYFTGTGFCRHPARGKFYHKCIRASLESIDRLWQGTTC
jgi:uncharacterized protein DUF6610